MILYRSVRCPVCRVDTPRLVRMEDDGHELVCCPDCLAAGHMPMRQGTAKPVGGMKMLR